MRYCLCYWEPEAPLAERIPVGNSLFNNSLPGYGNPTDWTLFNDSTSPTFSSNVRVVVNDGSLFPLVAGVVGPQFAELTIDHNNTSPTNPTPIIPANGS